MRNDYITKSMLYKLIYHRYAYKKYSVGGLGTYNRSCFFLVLFRVFHIFFFLCIFFFTNNVTESNGVWQMTQRQQCNDIYTCVPTAVLLHHTKVHGVTVSGWARDVHAGSLVTCLAHVPGEGSQKLSGTIPASSRTVTSFPL